jgi:hypothetical protein
MRQCGSRALASRCPTPFLPLAALLFSEKRPGDLPCRQLLIEIVQALFDVCPEAAEPIERTSAAWTAGSIVQVEVDSSVRSSDSGNGSSGGVRRYIRKMKGGADEEDDDAAGGAGLPGQDEREPIEVISTERRRKAHVLVHSLMQGPVSEKDEARLDFIQSAHRPRKFKLWVTEMSDIVRDYFWSVLASASRPILGPTAFAERAGQHIRLQSTGSFVTRKTCSGPYINSTSMRSRRPKSRRA